ncbi:unnamed protein product [Mytilus edulis]|uniref:Uncharacterized protein n=1 Tax=Mytilus edulis TaxID=6550 RepID=A0A8S3SFT9_MYTED|nr:unnamed protein product [Mytilus edulis]
MIDKGLVECGIWDFAGQKEYYPTHPTFLTRHAIYLLVADITDDIKPIQKHQQLEAESSGDYIDFWLDSIHCFCKDIKDCTGHAIKTSVIMVFTGIDKLEIPEENLKDTQFLFQIKTKEYETKFLGIFGRQEKGSHISSKVHFISNIKSPKEDFRNLREHISEIAMDMGFFFEELPTKWIQLENTLEILKDLKEKETRKTVVYLDKTEQSKLVICFSRNAISLQIWNSDKNHQHIVEELCSKIEDLEMKLCHKLEYKIQSKCKTGDYFSSSGRISHEKLNALCEGGQYLCEEHKCRHNKDDIENTWFKHLESTAESTDEKAPKIKSVNSPQEIVAEPNQPELENTVNSAHNTPGEAADVQKKQAISAETDILTDQFIEIKESTAESTDEMVHKNESVNSPQVIVTEPNQPELENTVNSAHGTSGEAADVQKKQAISAETEILPDQFIEIKESTNESTDEMVPKNESVNSPQEIVAEPNQPELERSAAKSTDEIAPKIKSVNSPKEILAEPNQSEIAEDLLDARCITGDAAKYSNTKLLITAQNDVSSDLEQKPPCYSEYESLDTRLNSFESWSSSKNQTREDLARGWIFLFR